MTAPTVNTIAHSTVGGTFTQTAAGALVVRVAADGSDDALPGASAAQLAGSLIAPSLRAQA